MPLLLVTTVYVTDLPPLFNWVHSILATLIVLTVLQNCCLPFVHNCLYLLALALFILCVLFDRPYLGVSSMHFNILLPVIYVNSFYMASHLVFSRVRLFVTIIWALLSQITSLHGRR